MKCGQDKKERAPLWPSPGHRELDGLRVPGVLGVLPGRVSGHAVGAYIPVSLPSADRSWCVSCPTHNTLARVVGAPARVLLDLAVGEEAAGEVCPGEQRPDQDPGLLNEFNLHANLVPLLPHDPLKPGQELPPGDLAPK